MNGVDGAKILCLVVVLERLNGILGNDCKNLVELLGVNEIKRSDLLK